jgi:hypothetical protein
MAANEVNKETPTRTTEEEWTLAFEIPEETAHRRIPDEFVWKKVLFRLLCCRKIGKYDLTMKPRLDEFAL